MTQLERLARLEHRLRPWLVRLPPRIATRLFSAGRTWFSHRLATEEPSPRQLFSAPVRAWNLEFRLPLWNAAGMFKDGGGRHVMVLQGAGAYVAGTTTATPRLGNQRNGINWPAVAYPASHAASNWMGLPNPGHTAVATAIARMERVEGCPIGASVSVDPGAEPEAGLRALISGMNAYSLAKVDYLELNESCPNVPGAHAGTLDGDLVQRLEVISEGFLRARHRPLPVVVKISNDLDPEQLPNLLHTLVTLQYDGIILGNTSTKYAELRSSIRVEDRALYDAFTKEYGGGVSGVPLRRTSLELCAAAQRELDRIRPDREFRVIRCGGVFGASDVAESVAHGVLLHQWYTGYFEAFARHGHDVYQRVSGTLDSILSESSLAATLS
jgi:dihydroorotate dehydrogenase